MEQFHSKTFVGIKQEFSIFHLLSVLGRFFEEKSSFKEQKRGRPLQTKANHKATLYLMIGLFPCLLLRNIHNYEPSKLYKSIELGRRKTRSGRSFMRISKTPKKWNKFEKIPAKTLIDTGKGP